MSVTLRLEREVESTHQCMLRFTNGRFKSRGTGDMNQPLVDLLHADTSLMAELRGLDLGGLTISLSGGKATVMLTPYGGGLAFLALPPCSTPSPFLGIRLQRQPVPLSGWNG